MATASDGSTTTPTMNSVGVVIADGSAKIQVGNNYSTVHNYPDSNPQKTTRAEFLRKLSLSPYKDRKNRNPKRADGTCEWFTDHPLFQNWQHEKSALLWVSADPGCGKSVLARYLVDDIFPSDDTRTTCYFFFKDDFEDQKGLESSLCCILHQLFVQRPALLSDDILDDFTVEGDQLFASFDKLWDMLVTATSYHNHGDIICILDALDECTDQSRLAVALTQLYSRDRSGSRLKFLVTSRPYLRIQREFQDLKESQPTIHLSGESQEEVEKIAQEIAITINQRLEGLCKKLRLDMKEKHILQEELAVVSHRTYLWVHLVFAALEEAVRLSRNDILTNVRNLPHTVEEAYNKILSKSHDPQTARKILHIVVAADRPLSLPEMATVLAFQASHRCHEDLEKDMMLPDHLHDAIRQACGLFVVIQDSQIFLLHQTAREFLVGLPPIPPAVRPVSLEWQYSLNLEESHRLLSNVCVQYLLLADFEQPENTGKSEVGRKFVFREYAASNWAQHYRQAHTTLDTDLERLALRLCRTNSHICQSWLKIFGEEQVLDPELPYDLTTSLLVASYFGLDNLVKHILKEGKERLDERGSRRWRTALSWASEKGYYSIAQSLLKRVPRYKVALRDWSMSPTIVNRMDGLGRTPLWYAAASGHQNIVELLLRSGAKVDSKDQHDLTPLAWAEYLGYNEIVEILLKAGARRDTKVNILRKRRLIARLVKAAEGGHEGAVHLLLERIVGDDTGDLSKALTRASENGHDTVVNLLLERGVRADNREFYEALTSATMNGYDTVVKLLLEQNVEASVRALSQALVYASRRGYVTIVNLLLKHGVGADAKDLSEGFICASEYGHDTIVNLLLEHGVRADNREFYEALTFAAMNGHDTVVKLLLEHSIGASIRDFSKAIIYASGRGYVTIVDLLLKHGVGADAKDLSEALIYASENGHDTIVNLLLEYGVMIDDKNVYGSTALIKASIRGYDTIVKLLLDHGAMVNSTHDNGCTALELASMLHHDTTKLLLDYGAKVGLKDKSG